MKSQFLEDVKYGGTSVLLTMRASGFAELTIIEPDMGYEWGGITRFPLTPNKAGLENAEKIASSLKAWAEYVQEVDLIQEG